MVGSGTTRVTTHNPVASKRQMVYKKLKENVRSSAASYLGALKAIVLLASWIELGQEFSSRMQCFNLEETATNPS